MPPNSIESPEYPQNIPIDRIPGFKKYHFPQFNLLTYRIG